MSYFHGANDAAVPAAVKLTTTSATAVYTVPSQANSRAKVDSLRICNTGAAVDVTVTWFDSSASDSFTLENRLAANSNQFAAGTAELIDLGGLILEASDELRVQAGTANLVHAVANVTPLNRPTNDPQTASAIQGLAGANMRAR